MFDSQFADSLKECERDGRSTCEPLHFDSLSPSAFTTSWKDQVEPFFINISKENAISIILSGIVSFDDEINNSIE